MELPDGTLQATGLANIEQIERDLWNTLQNPQKVSTNLLARADVEQISWQGKQLLLLRIPRAPRSALPVHVNHDIEHGTYIRVHDGDHRVTPEVAKRMLADSYTDRDAQPVTELSLNAVHSDSLARYRALLGSIRPAHPFLAKNDDDLLEAIGAAALDVRGTLRPTWAGLWMLGDETKLRRVLPHWHLSFKELPSGPNDPRRWIDRISPDGTWNANLFEFYMKVAPRILGSLKVPFATDQAQSRVDETDAHHALREALVNALVHADHRGTTGIRIIKNPQGFEFINPGLLLVSKEQLRKGGISEARNPVLQRLFSTLQLGEREGSGGPTMWRAWEAQRFRVPRVWLDPEHSETHLELPLQNLLPEWAIREAEERFGDRYQEQSDLGRLVIVTAIVEGDVGHARLAELGAAHTRDLTLKLQELMRKGVLDSRGTQRKKTYFAASGGSSGANGGNSAATVDSSDAKVDSSAAKVDSFDAKVDSSAALERLLAAERAPMFLVELAILDLCRNDFVAAADLARALRRTVSTVKSRYLPRLVDAGRLELRYPEAPTHPQQAYRTRREALP
jgi:predicted HTH transcriptional regulator